MIWLGQKQKIGTGTMHTADIPAFALFVRTMKLKELNAHRMDLNKPGDYHEYFIWHFAKAA